MTSTFRFERKYRNKVNQELQVSVNLIIDYQHKTFSVSNLRGEKEFVFRHDNNFAQRLAVLGCIQDAIEFAEQELKQTES